MLALSFSYPPSALPRAIQVARLLKNLNLPAVLVCAADEEKGVRKDHSLVAEAESFLTKCLRVPFVQSRWRNSIGRIAYRLDLPIFNKTPDQFTSWRVAVLHTVDNFLQSSQWSPNVLVTFGSPMSDHLIGLKLKRALGLPWVAHFSDPWVDNPFTIQDPLTKAFNRSLERKILATAERLVFTSAETVELVMAKYPSEWRTRVRVLPHSFEPDLSTAHPIVNSSDITIRYLGDLYGPRTPEPLFKALQQLMLEEPSLLCKVKFEIIGSTYTLNLAEIGLASLPKGLVNVKPSVNYAESLELMSSSDGLLIIDAPADRSVFLPSKLVDYIGAGQPILGITPAGTASDLIQQLGGWVSNPDNPSEVTRMLREFLYYARANRSKRLQPWGTPNVRQRFEAKRVAAFFTDILEELVSD